MALFLGPGLSRLQVKPICSDLNLCRLTAHSIPIRQKTSFGITLLAAFLGCMTFLPTFKPLFQTIGNGFAQFLGYAKKRTCEGITSGISGITVLLDGFHTKPAKAAELAHASHDGIRNDASLLCDGALFAP